MSHPAPTDFPRSGLPGRRTSVARHFLKKLRAAPRGWLVLSSTENMSGAPFHRLQNLRARLSFSARPMNDFSRMEESGAAIIAGKFMSAASDEITAQGGRPFSR